MPDKNIDNKNTVEPNEDLTPEECPRDPEDRTVHPANTRRIREKMMDKTLADSYPASDPPSSIPDPGEDDSMKSDIVTGNKDKAA